MPPFLSSARRRRLRNEAGALRERKRKLEGVVVRFDPDDARVDETDVSLPDGT